MSAKTDFHARALRVDEAAVRPLPNSRKVYMAGSRADIRVPMREIRQTDTHGAAGLEKNPPILVYDTSGPYTDPDARIDLRAGLPALRQRWIEERADTEVLAAPSSEYGRRRLADQRLAELRFAAPRPARRAPPGRAVTQMHYARKGMVTPEMEFVAIRESQRREGLAEAVAAQHAGEPFGAGMPREITPEQRGGLPHRCSTHARLAEPDP